MSVKPGFFTRKLPLWLVAFLFALAICLPPLLVFSQLQQSGGGPSAVTITSGTVTANQGGTWTVQPGNTANTTAWLVTGRLRSRFQAASATRLLA